MCFWKTFPRILSKRSQSEEYENSVDSEEVQPCFWKIFPRLFRMSQPEEYESSVDSEEFQLRPPPPPPANVDLTTVHPQSQSPLFSKIPGEIRNQIFSFALEEYVDPEKTYEREAYYTHPGYEGDKRMDVALLRTCKLIWSETRGIPERNTEIVFWLGDVHRAPENTYRLDHWPNASLVWGQGYVDDLANKFHDRGTHFHNRVQIFAQMYAIESGFHNLFDGREEILWQEERKWNKALPAEPERFLLPKVITLTLRYTDWWYWEANTIIYPISNTEFFDMRRIPLPPSVEKMVVEFENIELKKKELEGVISELFADKDRYVWNRQDGVKLRIKGEEKKGGVREWNWMGPTRINRARYAHHGEGDSMKMIVKVVEWVAEKHVEP
ncbi:hypothetical protein DM02DRAFT_675114 [Periconia macrospinosa]|uniref:Uncharacterized protein n=1 Tax=Periconia macrospinosa TaxID=97972 RepID=A0A2V1DCW0_9PLEO|nr:hypothetical protein DM02DRAFT_675114 [Periconia macrospinosa]